MGYYEEKKKYEISKQSVKKPLPAIQFTKCGYCGKNLNCKDGIYESIKCQGKHGWFSIIPFKKLAKNFICQDCAKKCSKCGKYFCPEHINNHKCKK